MKKSSLLVLTIVSLAMFGCGGGSRPAAPAEAPPASGEATVASYEVGDEARSASGAIAPTIQQREIVRTGATSLRVDDLHATTMTIGAQVRRVGGFVSNSSTDDLTSPEAHANLTIRVPVSKFDAFIDYLPSLGTLLSQSTNSEDITAQVLDYTARLKVMRAQEEVYIRLLKQATTTKTSLEVHDRIMRLRSEIESLDAQLRAQKESAAMSTIEVSLVSKVRAADSAQNKGWAKDEWQRGTNDLQETGRNLGRMIIRLFILTPLWLPFLLVGAWAWRKLRRRREAPPSAD